MTPSPESRLDPRVTRVREIATNMGVLRQSLARIPERGVGSAKDRSSILEALDECTKACLAAKVGDMATADKFFAKARALCGLLMAAAAE
jgi:hypothetical protein